MKAKQQLIYPMETPTRAKSTTTPTTAKDSTSSRVITWHLKEILEMENNTAMASSSAHTPEKSSTMAVGNTEQKMAQEIIFTALRSTTMENGRITKKTEQAFFHSEEAPTTVNGPGTKLQAEATWNYQMAPNSKASSKTTNSCKEQSSTPMETSTTAPWRTTKETVKIVPISTLPQRYATREDILMTESTAKVLFELGRHHFLWKWRLDVRHVPRRQFEWVRSR